MLIDEEISDFKSINSHTISIGVFDGVHKGHKYFLSKLLSESKKSQSTPTVITFKTHPLSLLNPTIKIKNITTTNDKIKMIKNFGITSVIPVTFDRNLSELSGEEFINKIKSIIKISSLFIGPDFSIGKNRETNNTNIKDLSHKLNFKVFEIPKIKQDSLIIRSTNIRSLITDGKVNLASKMLGYPFFIKGLVIKGLSRGKKLGFPTANIKIPDNIILPSNGIYATHVSIGKNKYFGATSIGNNPTFNETDKTIETFIIGFNDDIYNKNICLEFIHRIRDEIKFSSANKLSIQMANDVEKITNILKTTSSLLN
ncbi:MAG: bifunctional riboflavin kinase/FAD synthetase [SAR202 cluster bacterium]|jgi:riboflavin kinase/FMN adenylyltransferase|nr:bifunctional riboflavin kinase/FAD synthetase [SAR202 cluster bacterium]|tara:strand:+ start:581 stop:1519 length:939 start_codon:yes stop_codon:yes gene_type:complete